MNINPRNIKRLYDSYCLEEPAPFILDAQAAADNRAVSATLVFEPTDMTGLERSFLRNQVFVAVGTSESDTIDFEMITDSVVSVAQYAERDYLAGETPRPILEGVEIATFGLGTSLSQGQLEMDEDADPATDPRIPRGAIVTMREAPFNILRTAEKVPGKKFAMVLNPYTDLKEIDYFFLRQGYGVDCAFSLTEHGVASVLASLDEETLERHVLQQEGSFLQRIPLQIGNYKGLLHIARSTCSRSGVFDRQEYKGDIEFTVPFPRSYQLLMIEPESRVRFYDKCREHEDYEGMNVHTTLEGVHAIPIFPSREAAIEATRPLVADLKACALDLRERFQRTVFNAVALENMEYLLGNKDPLKTKPVLIGDDYRRELN